MSMSEAPFGRPDSSDDPDIWPVDHLSVDGVERSARWPDRLIGVARSWKSAPGGESGQALLGELWSLTNAAILKYLAVSAAGRPYFVDPEVMRDIASEKALSLIQRLDRGAWDPGETSPGQLCAFLGVVARNGLADYVRTRAAERRRAERMERSAGSPEALDQLNQDVTGPDTLFWREQFAGALRDCVRLLTPRARTIWFLKVFYELNSYEVGSHPDVQMKPGTVDVAWGRCRRQVQSCLSSRGFMTRGLPVGTFTTIWRFFRLELKQEV